MMPTPSAKTETRLIHWHVNGVPGNICNGVSVGCISSKIWQVTCPKCLIQSKKNWTYWHQFGLKLNQEVK